VNVPGRFLVLLEYEIPLGVPSARDSRAVHCRLEVGGYPAIFAESRDLRLDSIFLNFYQDFFILKFVCFHGDIYFLPLPWLLNIVKLR
jgi:hypothetical protein